MSQDSKMKNSFRNIVYGILKYSIAMVVPFFIRTMVINRLGSEYAGLGSLFTSILSVLNLSELGFSTAVVYAMYEPVAQNDEKKICALISEFKKIYRIVGSFILCVGLLACPFIKYLIKGSYPEGINIYLIYILLLINTVLSYLFNGYKSSLFVANQRSDINSKIETISYLVTYGLQMLFLLTIKDYYFYIASSIVGTIINNVFLGIYSSKMYPTIKCKGSIEKKERKKLFSNVGALFGHQLDVVIITSADNIVISAFLGLNLLAIYNNYYYVVSSVISLLIIVANSFTASIGNNIITKSKESNYRDFISFTYMLGLINIVCAVLMIVLYQDFMVIWMSEEMLLPMSTVILLVISFYVRQMRRALITYKTAAGIWRSDMFKPYVASIVNLCLNVILVHYLGVNGVIISTIASLLCIEIPWETFCVFKGYFGTDFKEYIKVQGYMCAKLAIVGSFSFYVMSFVPATNFGMLILKGGLSVAIIMVSIILISIRDRELKKVLFLIKGFMSKSHLV